MAVTISPVLVSKIGEEAATLIRSVPKLEKLVQIFGTVDLVSNVLVADRIVFGPNAILNFNDVHSSTLVIAANTIAFKDPSQPSIVARAKPTSGNTGDPGQPGPNGVNWSDSGGTGGPGGLGGPGLPQPQFVVFAGAFQSPTGSPMTKGLPLTFNLPASAGGPGGAGGAGGYGIAGQKGVADHRRWLRCVGGRDGGPGGNGGQGGRGGNGGAGSKGVTVVLVGPKSAADVFQYATILNRGGESGIPGSGGTAGSPGVGGDGDGSGVPCPSRPAGRPGVYPNPLNLGDGEFGQPGEKGDIFTYSLLDQADPFLW